MRILKIGLVAAAVAMATAMPANADDPYTQTGFNTGDAGFVSITFGATVAARGDSTTNGPSDGAVDAKCEFYQVTRPSSNEVQLVVQGHAHAAPRGTVRAVGVSLRCVLKNKFTGSVVFDGERANEGSQNVWVPPSVVTTDATSYIVCTATKALWADGAITQNTTLACQYPV